MSPAQIAAIGVLLSAILSAIVSYIIAERRLATEKRLEIAAHQAIRKLLSQPGWELRTFGAIKNHLRGFTDDALRQHLVAAGAVAFAASDGAELWGLLDRNEGKLKPSQSNQVPQQQEQTDVQEPQPQQQQQQQIQVQAPQQHEQLQVQEPQQQQQT